MQIKQPVRRILTRIMTALLAMLMLCPAASAAVFKAKIASSSAQVYKNPSENSASVKGLKNLTVTVTAQKDGWAQIQYRGRTGYIQIRDLDLTRRITAYTSGETKVYRSVGGSEMGVLKKGTTVYVIGMDGDYCRVQNASRSVTGYIAAAQLTTSKPAGSAAATTSSLPSGLASTTTKYRAGMSAAERLEYALYLAQSQLGKSSRDSSGEGFDCAGLSHYCYTRAGFPMAASAQTQGSDARYKPVRYSELKRGDLLCFDLNPSDEIPCDHTGIYLGRGYFIHASSGTGRVIVSNMEKDSNSYYKKVFCWGKRIG